MNNYYLTLLILFSTSLACCAEERPGKKQTEWLIPHLGTNVYTNLIVTADTHDNLECLPDELLFMRIGTNVYTNLFATAGTHRNLERPPDEWLIPHLGTNVYTNLIVTADMYRLMECPPALTNRVWNTNLLSLTEQKRVRGIEARYRNVSTTNPPPDTKFKEAVVRYVVYPEIMIKRYPGQVPKIDVLVFDGNENGVREELWLEGKHSFRLRHTDKNGDGFLCKFVYETLTSYYEIKNNKLDGLYMLLAPPNKQEPYERDVIWRLMRFKDGKMVGTWIDWYSEGQIRAKIEITTDFEMPELLEKLTNYRWVSEDYTKEEVKRP